MMPLPPPREFQAFAIAETRRMIAEAIASEKTNGKKLIVCAPTGAGKSIFAAMVMQSSLERGKRCLFVCDRKTLILQISATLDKYGLDHGILQSGNRRFNMNKRLQVCSIQTIHRRAWPDADLIIYDEAHGMPKALTSHLADFKGVCLGLTATPFTKGLGKHYGGLINATTMSALTQAGTLVPWRILSGHRIDMRGAEVDKAGEWTDEAASKGAMKIVGDIVTNWQAKASHLKTLAFVSSINACESLQLSFANVGVNARTFTAETKDAERCEIMADFLQDDPQIRMLITVEALAKGFDSPSVGAIIDARPLRKSLSTVVQMWGRGLRSSPGKTECVILDHSGNAVRFADDLSDLFFSGVASLDDGEKLNKEVKKDDEKEPGGKMCSQCGYQPCGRVCVSCGHRAPVQNQIEHEPGELKEIDIFKGAQALAESPRALIAQLASYVATYGKPETAQCRLWHLYKDISKGAPFPRGVTLENCGRAELTSKVHGMIRRKNIAFANKRDAK